MESIKPEPENINLSAQDMEYSKKDANEASLEIKAYFIDEAFAELDSSPDSETEPPHEMINICLEKHAGNNDVSKEKELAREIKAGQSMVAELVVSSNLPSAEIEQRNVVENVDKIPQNVVELRLACADELLDHTNEPREREKLENFRNDIIKQMALPFTERIKLASILVEENKLAEAETTLKEAARLNLNPRVNSKAIDRLRKFAFTKAFELELSRLMPTFVSSNFAKFDTSNNQFLSRAELNNQLSSDSYSSVERGILQYMIQNFDTIKASVNDQTFRERAISLRDVNAYYSNTRPFEFR